MQIYANMQHADLGVISCTFGCPTPSNTPQKHPPAPARCHERRPCRANRATIGQEFELRVKPNGRSLGMGTCRSLGPSGRDEGADAERGEEGGGHELRLGQAGWVPELC